MRAKMLAWPLLAAIAIGVVGAAPAFAQGPPTGPLEPQDVIVLSGRLVIAEGETASSAVIFHGPAVVQGTVTGSVVVFDGRADISGTVDGDVVVFNGPVRVRSGAVIKGDLISSQTPTVDAGATVQGQRSNVATRFRWSDFGIAGRFAWWLGYSVSTLVLGLVLLLIGVGLDGALARAGGRIGGSFGFGALTFFLLPVAAIVLLATVVAIPLGIFLLLALALVYTVGYVAAAHVVGRLLVKPPTSRFLAFLAGWGILRVIGLVPVLGGLTWFVAALFGLGALWLAARGPGAERPAAAAPTTVPDVPPAPVGPPSA